MADITEKPKRKSVAFSEGTTIVDSDGQVTEQMANGSGDKTTAESHSHEASGDAAVDEVTDMFKDLAKKKKKKPKKEDDGEAGEQAADDGDDIDLGALKKKKKKKSSKTADVDDFEKQLAEAGEAGEAAPEEEVDVDAGDPIQGMLRSNKALFLKHETNTNMTGTGIWQHESTQAIPYKLLLSRFFTLLSDRHPDLVGGSGKSYKIPPPQCLREGNKKTLLANLPEICKRLKRSDEHVTSFLFAELGTSGSVDGSRRLVIKGRFQSKQIEK
jgi:translation initiation factor 2 subunit 2